MGAHSIMGDICDGGSPFTTELSAKEKKKVAAGIPLALSRACLLASRPYFLKVMPLPAHHRLGTETLHMSFGKIFMVQIVASAILTAIITER